MSMIRYARSIRFGFAIFFVIGAMSISPAYGDGLSLTEAGVSSDLNAVRKTLDTAPLSTIVNPEDAWRLLRAYYRYYDELDGQNREADRSWAAAKARAIAEQAYAKHPTHPAVVYWSGMAGLAYLETNQMKALFIASDLLARYEKARELDSAMDDWGPDRMLGILAFSLPGWPLSKGDNDKAMLHLEKASQHAPSRAVNRLYYAKALLKDGQTERALRELDFLEKGQWKVSSPHWRMLMEKKIRALAEEAR